MRPTFALLLSMLSAGLPLVAVAAPLRYELVIFDVPSGEMVVTPGSPTVSDVTFQYRSNGRGPTLAERIETSADGSFLRYEVTGHSEYGGKVDERFAVADGRATWSSTADKGAADVAGPAYYLPASGTPEAGAALVRGLLASAGTTPNVLPGGALSVRELVRRTLDGPGGKREVKLVALLGNGNSPDLMWLDAKTNRLFASISPGAAQLVETGWRTQAMSLEAEQTKQDERLLQDLSAGLTHRLDRPLLIRGARVFDSEHATLGAPSDVYVDRGRIAAVVPAGSAPGGDVAVVEAAGRTLLPGLFDMHAHYGSWSGTQHLAAGVTSVRDMANINSQLRRDRENIAAGRVIGPNVFAHGAIEGTGENANRLDFMVDSLAKAKEAVDWYAQRGYEGIKIYNSFPREHLAATIAHAHSLGLKVNGHVPAFLRAEDAVLAGYDELTHINQVMLNFLVTPQDDTRTLMRFERIMERGGALDLASAPVTRFVALLAERGVAVDPTLAVFEDFYQRAGDVHPSYAAVIDHLPVSLQRVLRTNTFDVTDANLARNRQAFQRMSDLVGALHRGGVTLLAGTDYLAGITLHRELELYVAAGIPAAEVLRIATWNGARAVGALDRLGSVTRGKQADLVLVDGDPTADISVLRRPVLVVKNGELYYPDEIHTAIGTKPFATSVRPAR